FCPRGLGGNGGKGGLVVLRALGKPAMKDLEGPAQLVRRRTRHHGRIQTAGEICPQGDIASNLQPQCIAEQISKSLDELILRAMLIDVEARVPVAHGAENASAL